MRTTRRQFAAMGAASLGAALASRAETVGGFDQPAVAAAGTFHFAVVSDTHVIDRFYVAGSENSPEDNDSIQHANERITLARDVINGVRFQDGSCVERVFLPGDVFHNFPSTDPAFYQQNKTRIHIAREILDGFQAPVSLGFGNHDYDPSGHVSREMANGLHRQILRTEPYHAVDYKGFRFLQLNNFLGDTWAPGNNQTLGSFGETQLQWAEAQLAARKPTVVFVHYPLWLQSPTEVSDFGLHPLLRKYQDSIVLVIAGHWHKWIDFAHTYGPQHYVTAATRFDPHSFMLFRADAQRGTVDWLDRSRVHWSTHYADALTGPLA